jgi:glutathione S-transferase
MMSVYAVATPNGVKIPIAPEELDETPHVARWFEATNARPAVGAVSRPSTS